MTTTTFLSLNICDVPIGRLDLRAVRGNRFVRCRKQPHHSQAALAVAARGLPGLDALQEMLAHHAQRLGFLEARHVDVAVVVGAQELAERVVVRRVVHALVVDLNLRERVEIIVDQHLLRADHADLADLERIDPAHVDHRAGVVAAVEGDERRVLDLRVQQLHADRADALGLQAGGVEDDREIVRGEVPDDVDVALENAQVQPGAVDVEHIAQHAALDDLFHLVDAGRILEGVVHHQDLAVLLRKRDQFLGLVDLGRQRLLDQDMLAGLERLLRQRIVRADVRADGNGIDRRVVDDVVVVGGGLDARVEVLHVREALLVHVAADRHLARGNLVEVADDVGSPVACPNYSDLDAHSSLKSVESVAIDGLKDLLAIQSDRQQAPLPTIALVMVRNMMRMSRISDWCSRYQMSISHGLIERHPASAVNLPPAGDPGQSLQPPAVPVFVELDLIGRCGLGPTMLISPLKHIHKLRQLVQAGAPAGTCRRA